MGVAAAVAAVGCDVGDATRQPIDTPAVTLNAFLATTTDGSPGDPKVVAETSRVVPSSSLRLRFDRYLLPVTVSRQSMCLQASTNDVAGPADCSAPIFFQPAYDPVRREIVLRQEAGARFALDTTYKLTLYGATEDGNCTPDEPPETCGVRAFDRAPLDKPYVLTFRTVDTDPGSAPDETAPAAQFCGTDSVSDFLANTCAYAKCHASQGPVGAAMNLDFAGLPLGDPTRLRETAINKVAHQTQMGEDADNPEETPARFGRAMPIIDAFEPNVRGNPGNSYLMFKLLVGASGVDGPSDVRPSAEEVARVRASVVVGMPMPPLEGNIPSLTREQLLTLSNWIAAGAPTQQCP